jgi:hypothetical protein
MTRSSSADKLASRGQWPAIWFSISPKRSEFVHLGFDPGDLAADRTQEIGNEMRGFVSRYQSCTTSDGLGHVVARSFYGSSPTRLRA